MSEGLRAKPADTRRDTRAELIDAGRDLFSAVGFNGASAREIERLAHVNRGLLAYHFGTKYELWQQVMNEMMERFHDFVTPYVNLLPGMAPVDRRHILLRVYAQFAQDNPDYFRMLVIEGALPSPRLSWFVQTHLRPTQNFYRRMVGSHTSSDEAAAMALFSYVGAVSMIFAAPALCSEYFGFDPKALPDIERVSAEISVQVGTLLPNLIDKIVADAELDPDGSIKHSRFE
jgi:AcrR family transcriptional regulator